jgi:hypothetical protein
LAFFAATPVKGGAVLFVFRRTPNMDLSFTTTIKPHFQSNSWPGKRKNAICQAFRTLVVTKIRDLQSLVCSKLRTMQSLRKMQRKPVKARRASRIRVDVTGHAFV